MSALRRDRLDSRLMTSSRTPDQKHYDDCVQAFLAPNLTPEQRAKRGKLMDRARIATFENREQR